MFEVLHRFNYLFKRVFIHLLFHFFFSFDNLSSFIQTFFLLPFFFHSFLYSFFFIIIICNSKACLYFHFFLNFGVRSNGLVDCHETGAPAKRSRLFSHLLCAPGDDAAKSKSGDCVNCGPGRPDNRPKRK